MKTTFRPVRDLEPKMSGPVRLLVTLFGGILAFAITFFATNLLLSFSGAVLSLGRAFPGTNILIPWLETKGSLIEQNKNLEDRLLMLEDQVRVSHFFINENLALRSMLGQREFGEKMVLGNVVAHPNISPYDTFVIDVGAIDGLVVGDTVLAEHYTAIGTILSLQKNSAVVGLFSNGGRETPVVIGDSRIPATLKGHGGGNFTIDLPKDAQFGEGDVVALADHPSRVVGVVGAIETGPDSSSKTLLVTYPLNIFTLPRVFVTIPRE